ncbi:FAD-dependent oxidoreductase [Aureitalea marina]|uniref:Kynurenine 3-monooxygenase n=1 Tax=Aureitalea marina TaxID=930804 RepID=A0A2S7KMF8_9FLAO|nr:NAD(P)/FAD-dependent oxidoreductase [Aureitalea marina]PQB03753.1 kynurenine 3-monooxygenase [Aureitalea marina]
MSKKEHILIIGAGLCGSLLALRLAQRGYHVSLVEKRPDLRKVDQVAGRSINLALSDRGLQALALAGVDNQAKELCIPMRGRMIHQESGEVFLRPYSGRDDEHINSISRPGLNMMLLNALDDYPQVKVYYNHICENVDLEMGKAWFTHNETGELRSFTGDVLIGTDGAGSAVRRSMYEHKKFLFSFSQQWLTHGYKELEIPPGPNGEFLIDANSLHIWPRGADMLIALPNLDGSFTVTLFAPWRDSDYGFDNLDSKEKVQQYFEKEFPDTLHLIPDLTDQFFTNPTSPLGTIKCSPWSSYGKTLLMGDAAHAIVPFYGQGMNASFEDVLILDQVLDQTAEDWNLVLKTYEKARKVNTDAIADLAVDNFYEMKEHTASPLFQAKRKLEVRLEQEFPEAYFSKYSLVTFHEDLPYSEAMRRGRAQDKAILNLLDDGKIDPDGSLEEILEVIVKQTNDILEDDALLKNL